MSHTMPLRNYSVTNCAQQHISPSESYYSAAGIFTYCITLYYITILD